MFLWELEMKRGRKRIREEERGKVQRERELERRRTMG